MPGELSKRLTISIAKCFRVSPWETIQNQSEFSVTIKGISEDLPVFIENPDIDFSVCAIGKLYQSQFMICNSSKISKNVSFEIPSILRDMVQVFPSSGFVQPLASLRAQVRFEPGKALLQSDFYSSETGILEIKLQLAVSDQVRRLDFSLIAILTSNKLQLSTRNIDFGFCTIYESVFSTIQVHFHKVT